MCRPGSGGVRSICTMNISSCFDFFIVYVSVQMTDEIYVSNIRILEHRKLGFFTCVLKKQISKSNRQNKKTKNLNKTTS